MPRDPRDPHETPQPAWRRLGQATSAAVGLAALAAAGLATPAHAESPGASSAHHSSAESGSGHRHTVSPGDSLWAIAVVNGITVEQLMEANDLRGDASLHPGQKLAIPVPGERKSSATRAEADTREGTKRDSSSKSPAKTSSDATRARPDSAEGSGADTPAHEVAPGDTLWDLAIAHGTTVAEIVDMNDLDLSAGLKPGQRLELPAAAAASSSKPSPQAAPKPVDAPERAEKKAAAKASSEAESTSPGHGDAALESARAHHRQIQEAEQPSREQAIAMVRETAREMGVDPALALAHAEQESDFVHRQVSDADAIGLMQVIPSAGDWAQALTGEQLDLFDPRDNVRAGVAIIKANRAGADSESQAIAAYYQGLHGVKEYGTYADTKAYVKGVKAKRARW